MLDGYEVNYVLVGRMTSWIVTALLASFGGYGVAVLARAYARFRGAMSEIGQQLYDGLMQGLVEVVGRNVERQESAVLRLRNNGAAIRFDAVGAPVAYHVGDPVINVRPLLSRREVKKIDKAARKALREIAVVRRQRA